MTTPDPTAVLALLRRIEAGVADLSSARLVGEPWTDDHVLCFKVAIEGVTITLLWCGWETAAAATYAATSPQAQADLRATLLAALTGADDEDRIAAFVPDHD